MQFLSASNPKRLLSSLLLLLIATVLGFGLGATPASADSVGEDLERGITGNVTTGRRPHDC